MGVAPLLILDASDAPTEDRGSGSSSTSLEPGLEHAPLIVLMQADDMEVRADDMEVSSKAHLEQDTGRRAAIRAPSSAIKHPTSS
jgi:hypothetical protein